MAINTPTVGTLLEEPAGSSTSDVPYPAVVNAGDCLVLGVVLKVNSGTGISNPGGWTVIDQFSGVAGTAIPTIGAWLKIADGSEGGGVLTVTHTTQVLAAQILAFGGVDTGTRQDATHTIVNGGTGSTTVLPAITIVTTGAALVSICAQNDISHTATPPSGFTETADRLTGIAVFEMAYQLGFSTGSTGTKTVTWSGSAGSVGILVALRPAVGVNATVVFPSRTDVLISG